MARFAAAVLLSIIAILATILVRGNVLSVTVVVLLIWAIRIEAEIGGRNASAAASRQARGERAPGQLPAEAVEYLTRLDSRLELPAEMRAEIRAELADHLNDSIAAIQAEGRDLDFATGEALARLGQPDELARQLRRAHQTTRRLLAGAAGGVWAAAGGAVWGGMLAVAILFIAAIAIGVGLRPLVDFAAAHIVPVQFNQQEIALGTAIGATLAWLPAFIAGRRAVQACAAISGRPVAQLGRWWAIAGVLGLGWLVLFVLTVQQSWLVVAFEFAIPLAFAAGALIKIDSKAPTTAVPWRFVAAGLLLIGLIGSIVLVPAGFLGSGTQGNGWDTSYTDDSIGWNHVAPHSPDQSINLGYSNLGHSGTVEGGAPSISVQDPATLAPYHDLRFEAWRAVAYPGAPSQVDLGLLDTSYSAPYATAPAVVGPDGTIDDPISLSGSRTPKWWIFLTGVGPDGQRYWLGSRPFFVERNFTGTAWDWLTASN